MQPKLLLMKLQRVVVIAEKETLFDQHNTRWIQLEPGMISKQLMWENKQIQSRLRSDFWMESSVLLIGRNKTGKRCVLQLMWL